MAADRKAEIIARQREIDSTIADLHAERRRLSTELKSLKRSTSQEALMPAIFALQTEWTLKPPAVKIDVVRAANSRTPVKGAWYDRGYGYARVKVDSDVLTIVGDYTETSPDLKCILTVKIRRKGVGGGVLFSTKKTFKDMAAMEAGASDLFHQAVLKAAKKLAEAQA
jgi:hypothetical protein